MEERVEQLEEKVEQLEKRIKNLEKYEDMFKQKRHNFEKNFQPIVMVIFVILVAACILMGLSVLK